MSPDNRRQPLVTFALFAYNQEVFIREAVEGALAQTYSPLQIILSDDRSTDRTFAIMEEMAANYSGSNAILLNRNEKNLGIAEHINKIMRLAQSDFIVIAAGDDISVPERTNASVEAWLSEEGITSVHSQIELIDRHGNHLGYRSRPDWQRLNDPFFVVQHLACVTGSSHAWSRKLFTDFGDINADAIQEDHVLALRSALVGKTVYIEKTLVKYRVNVGISNDGLITRQDRLVRIPDRYCKNHITILNQHKKDIASSVFKEKQKLNAIVDNMLLERHILLRFINSEDKTKALIDGIKNGLKVSGLLKNYLKYCLPQRVITFFYWLKGF